MRRPVEGLRVDVRWTRSFPARKAILLGARRALPTFAASTGSSRPRRVHVNMRPSRIAGQRGQAASLRPLDRVLTRRSAASGSRRDDEAFVGKAVHQAACPPVGLLLERLSGPNSGRSGSWTRNIARRVFYRRTTKGASRHIVEGCGRPRCGGRSRRLCGIISRRRSKPSPSCLRRPHRDWRCRRPSGENATGLTGEQRNAPAPVMWCCRRTSGRWCRRSS